MISFFTVTESGEKPPEQEPEPAGDGDPSRSSTAPAKGAEYVADHQEEFEEPQTGVSIDCDPNEQEIYSCLKKMSRSGASHTLSIVLAACMFLAGIVCVSIVRNLWGAVTAACMIFVGVSMLAKPAQILHREARKLVQAGGGQMQLAVYPDHIGAPAKSGEMEVPLDGTSKLLKTESAFVVDMPPQSAKKGPAHRILILPFRCIGSGTLPYVEATLLAGTRPFTGKKDET